MCRSSQSWCDCDYYNNVNDIDISKKEKKMLKVSRARSIQEIVVFLCVVVCVACKLCGNVIYLKKKHSLHINFSLFIDLFIYEFIYTFFLYLTCNTCLI